MMGGAAAQARAASPALVALRAAGLLPDLRPDLAEMLDSQMTPIAAALLASGVAKSIIVNDASNPLSEVPCVLQFSKAGWAIARAGIADGGRRDGHAAVLHDALPTADGSVVLAPNLNRVDAAAVYTVVRDEERMLDRYRVAVVRQVSEDEVVWEGGDNRCTLVRYSSGALECHDADCEQACGGPTVTDDTGVEHVPCGCPH
jgi:hypothetical protein